MEDVGQPPGSARYTKCRAAAAWRCTAALHHFGWEHAQELAIGVYAPVTSNHQGFIAMAVSFDLDLRKNFEPALVTRFGPPIITIPDLHPDIANVTMRIGTSHSQPDVGVETALDFMLGLDGGTPVSALVGGIFSSIAMPVASVSAVRKVPQIAYGASSPALSNKDTYPYFLRTAPPDSIQAQAFWSWIVTFQARCRWLEVLFTSAFCSCDAVPYHS
ncbi:Grm2 [Symbiodinium natans]|uniref:Grm2 protein n=1 Tax=Symbiodinium natans TaxID=878477 RepID=A0A812N2B5_9DINO|nr:Grm2 [Symbiodinium natans]